ncbi:MAG TPA: YdaS family helix-turn-helix protein [Candidatus Competibacteraceae bacterium]|nr:YdaS family helix-turn-helix protein [Candidatus Competibacteraceae bacterium]
MAKGTTKAVLTPSQAALQKVIDGVGGQTALAKAIGKKQGHIWKWRYKTKKGVPAEYVLLIEQVAQRAGVNITRHELRPDLYPRE